jgi:hypothetical protein
MGEIILLKGEKIMGRIIVSYEIRSGQSSITTSNVSKVGVSEFDSSTPLEEILSKIRSNLDPNYRECYIHIVWVVYIP